MSSLNPFSPIQTTTPLTGTPDTDNTLHAKQVLLKFVLIGDAQTGKTSIISKFTTNQFTAHYTPTAKCTSYTSKDTLHSPLPSPSCSSSATQQIVIDDDQTNKKYIIQLQLWDTKGTLPADVDIPAHFPQLLKSEKPHSSHSLDLDLDAEPQRDREPPAQPKSIYSPSSWYESTKTRLSMSFNYQHTKNNVYSDNEAETANARNTNESDLELKPVQNNIRHPMFLTKFNNLHSVPFALSSEHELDLVSFFDEVDAKEAMEEEDQVTVDEDERSPLPQPTTADILDVSDKPPTRQKKKIDTHSLGEDTNVGSNKYTLCEMLEREKQRLNVRQIDLLDADLDINQLALHSNSHSHKHIDLKQHALLTASTDLMEHRHGYSSESPPNTCTMHKMTASSCDEMDEERVHCEPDEQYELEREEEEMSFNDLMMESLDALILVYDITNESSFTHLNGWISLFTEHNIDGEDVPILLLANKKDLECERLISAKQGRKFCHQLKNAHKLFGEVSAKCDHENGDEIKDIFTELARQCINREASVLSLMSCDSIESIQAVNQTTFKRALRSNDFSIKTCTQHICGSNAAGKSQQNEVQDPFCVVL